jgi:hypothetical protein
MGMLLVTVPAAAAKYESLAPLLIDLGGWEANKVEGMDMWKKLQQAAKPLMQ